MLAMQLPAPGMALQQVRLAVPLPAAGQVLLKVEACGVCRTDLHVQDGEVAAACPVVPGHEVVGRVCCLGAGVTSWQTGERAGAGWLAGACGACHACLRGAENLCDAIVFNGCHHNGGYAEYMLADAAYLYRLPVAYDAAHAAPLLCAGLIGYRAYALAGPAERLGIYGFGAAAHLLVQLARQQGRQVYAFTRPGDLATQAFARSLGAAWAGGADQAPPAPLDAALIFAPDGALVPRALAAVRKGGAVVCGGIHMSDIPAMPYALLWGERSIRSVANLTRADAQAFLALAGQYPLQVAVQTYPLEQANEALADLRAGLVHGAAVLLPGGG
ncbi:zinc-dependent alcohol dehydrogenase family protein [Pseudoduganella ginsengisoli]|uniref:Zinc-binding alcohol dehydrogenase family protein n=1 Tax=Pseudoduganella ginsengisoli TaxID=1462440 RepID=A0A6L6Q5E8_9BURK|nr:zinc-dependent alcohol dehydrogenase family protein [Pseudoduganella ginsengisoli]MTW04624.1 zinc-binding alcohol dehydrogenase family protein [Pseudoduganella ginsengisoli]